MDWTFDGSHLLALTALCIRAVQMVVLGSF